MLSIRKIKRIKKKVATAAALIAAVVIACVSLFGGSPADAGSIVNVTRVIDGDTIEVVFDGTKEKVRLIGIDTPESVHPDKTKNVPYGKIATEFTRSSLEGKEVQLEFDVQERDRYGRLLAYVYVGATMFNETLLEEGHAVLATYQPNVRYVEFLTAAQSRAAAAGNGLWSEEYDQ
jgi:micrococcal nuclease